MLHRNRPNMSIQHYAQWLLIIVVALIVLGLVFIYSASSVYALSRHGSAHYFLRKQCTSLCIAIFAFIVSAHIPSAFWQRYASVLCIITLSITALTVLPIMPKFLPVRINGAQRWLSMFGMTIQPGEFLKFFLLIYTCTHLAQRSVNMTSFKKTLLPLILPLATASFILLQQPDFGSVVTMVLTIGIILFIAGYDMLPLLLMSSIASLAGIALIISQPYRLRRLLTFFDPWQDPTGKGFQIIQSLIAIGSGSWWGAGIAHSKQKFFYLPMQHTDFIFPIIAEETGFVGAMLLFILYLSLLIFGLRLAANLRDQFASLLTISFILLISIQASINFMVTLGLVPTKGLGLPFVSYGGSALICSAAMIGCIMRMVKEAKKTFR